MFNRFVEPFRRQVPYLSVRDPDSSRLRPWAPDTAQERNRGATLNHPGYTRRALPPFAARL